MEILSDIHKSIKKWGYGHVSKAEMSVERAKEISKEIGCKYKEGTLIHTFYNKQENQFAGAWTKPIGTKWKK